MYQLYAYATPNSIKPAIMLEEIAQPWQLHTVNLRQGEQTRDDFLALNPNGKVPVLQDSQTGMVLSESAAILLYLAGKHQALLPSGPQAQARVFEQLFFHASAVSPAFGQAGFFTRLASEPQPLAQQRFSREAMRVTGLLDRQLSDSPWLAGEEYSIADIAHYGWLWRREFAGVSLATFPHLRRWFDLLSARPAVIRATEKINALFIA
ncbi:glutathione S-transferase [Erwinia sp. OLTSP20]|uniref:glutathione S-transferase family protein n=1 Tax=unclassified Erwinia TaxID=2622719 RepID=UPI000C187BC4|nr:MULTISPECIES: glutathione S-transferase family protein [unclassified Erwinia]PIJ49415.1 glutathione S-transferase [Erwinia sp. OAMSP11]PIJ71091.1 glutathione S-transferase [Erwinia sp. OLSSP12]PIJ79369.1 glutathione S-transferase [Erwinia sp. OLCASP19]PIJ80907.1 glutathione S-transferase [Erwinia sp. OLMTSP26]PIJ83709.1 glutathione S-transferase [Erwinia sp. OLMDSP33]